MNWEPNFSVTDRIYQILLWFAYRMAKCYWFVFRPKSQGAYIAVWCDNKILVIRNSYRLETSLPAGGVKSNETPLKAAARELREEVGIALNESQLHPVAKFLSRDEFKYDESTVFEARLASMPEIRVDNREVVSAEFIDLKQFEMIKTTSIVEQYRAWRLENRVKSESP